MTSRGHSVASLWISHLISGYIHTTTPIIIIIIISIIINSCAEVHQGVNLKFLQISLSVKRLKSTEQNAKFSSSATAVSVISMSLACAGATWQNITQRHGYATDHKSYLMQPKQTNLVLSCIIRYNYLLNARMVPIQQTLSQLTENIRTNQSLNGISGAAPIQQFRLFS